MLSTRLPRAVRPLVRAASTGHKKVVLVDGCRIPFQPSRGEYFDLMSYDLTRLAMHGLLTKTAVDPKAIDYVLWGKVIQEPKTSNIARDAAFAAGIPRGVPAHTVTQACISSNQAICTGASQILSGQAEVVLAGGVETFSDAPIRYSRPIRKKLIKMSKAKSPGQMASIFLKGLKMKDLAPEQPAIANFLTGEVMGHNADRLSDRFGVSRREQEEFALRSHLNAASAHADGFYDGEVIAGPGGKTLEDGPRADSSLEKMATLKPAFVKPHGTVTAASASPFTDGASATLLMADGKASELGLSPKAELLAYAFVACDPFEELLLGPTYGASKVLRMANLSLKDIDVIEFHEAFAGQVLSNLVAMDSDKFFAENLPGVDKVGSVDMTKLNTKGGSLSIGHPFGATGARLVTTAANRLVKEGGTYALVAACADGGLGHACILKRYGA
mmetsp:Transcript_15382/g.49397  ORF Transcript_15382/g.49397 Transcript_15382/m.49397 type:complete len:444 (+) Transcript_15382:36-1367(+)|eukprot:CAMPEP_0185475146 /NCGR_PEP_ID=MMETSP1366-20130426/2382_1 /TAXON_ID=38817 /ORGANISM="Gephyrocapsa oceanica, Strain RCC1303" /LENGTH=443 /DNA_ID=CAMNT_0028082049 /DNA_START=40 /DNA_END=1371 /DNA_ORIENTATION=+